MKNLTSTKVIRGLLVFVLFFTPLIFGTDTNEQFEFPKMFFVYFLGSTLIFFYGVSLIFNTKQTKINVDLVAGGFILVNILSTLFSSHLYTSIWGYYSRFNGGLVSTLIFFGIYLVVKNCIKKDNILNILDASLLSLLPINFYAIYQHFTLDPNSRVYSTLGQPNWLGAYVAILLPIALYKMYTYKCPTNSSTQSIKTKQKSKLKQNQSRQTTQLSRKQTFYLIVSLSSITTIWFTYSLSTLLALGISTLVFLGLHYEIMKKHYKLTGLLALYTALMIVLEPGLYWQRIHDVFLDIRKVHAQTITTSEQTYEQISDPGFIRLNIWKGTLQVAAASAKNVLVGTGPETFPYEFQTVRPQQLNYSSEWDFILNKPHNYYLELFVETGIFGLALYLILLIQMMQTQNKVVMPALVAFGTTNFFGWPTVSTALLFWVFLAYSETNTKAIKSTL